MFESWPTAKRIQLARDKMKKVIDHFLYVLGLHANNEFVVYSPMLSSQIPTSFAANAFNVFQLSMHQIEIVRLCALWDAVDFQRENIPTVIELIDHDTVIEALADEERQHWAGQHTGVFDIQDAAERAIAEQALKDVNAQFGMEQAAKARSHLKKAIQDARAIIKSSRLAAVMNIRDKHLAHSLTMTHREKHGPVAPMKYGDETALINDSSAIVEHLYCWVNGTSFSIEDSREIDQKNAQALWTACKFDVVR